MTIPGLDEYVRRARPTTIYRHYDKCGCLLYVGITYDAIQRNHAHTGQSWWAPWIDRIQLEEATYIDRRAALDAERELIRGEAPIFNTVHAVDQDRLIIRYLVGHERWEHLSVAASVSPREKQQLLRTLAEADLLDGVTWMKEPAEHATDWSDPLLRRFVAKTEIDDRGCWRWQGAFRDHHPYFRSHPKTRMATRVAWLLFRGPIPDGMRVGQLCGMTDCVNPRHLVAAAASASHQHFAGSLASCEANHPGVAPRWMRRTDGRSACRECNRILSARRRGAARSPDSLPSSAPAPFR